MREIKFRAWDMREKCWIGEELDDLIIFRNNELIISDRFALMQYTGLKDKNGKEIYEGDVVKRRDKTIWQVKFLIGKFSLFANSSQLVIAISKSKEETEEQRIARELEIWWTSCEVIGNIWENPELIE